MSLTRPKTCILQLSCLLTLSLSLPVFAKSLTFATDQWCPFVCDNAEAPGYVTEITKHIFQLEGYEISIFKIPFKRALIATENKDFEGVLLVSQNDISSYALMRNKLPVASTGVAFFVKRSSTWKFTDKTSLERIHLGLVNGYSYGVELDNIFRIKHKQNTISWAHGSHPIEQNLSKLMKNRIDAIFDSREVIEYTANRMGLSDLIQYAGSDDLQDELFIGFSDKGKNAAELASIYDKGLSILRKNGDLGRILESYGLRDWEVGK